MKHMTMEECVIKLAKQSTRGVAFPIFVDPMHEYLTVKRVACGVYTFFGEACGVLGYKPGSMFRAADRRMIPVNRIAERIHRG